MSDRARVTEIATLAAERELELQVDDQPPRAVVVRIGVPVPDPGGPDGDWVCPFQIVGGNRFDETVRGIHGVDAVQALQLTMQLIGVVLDGLRTQGKLTFLGDEAHGFPPLGPALAPRPA